jgi:hypothetical protein
MKAPRFARLTLSLDTEAWRMMPEHQRSGAMYLVNRLLSGETVADSEFEYLRLKVRVETAVSPEIIRG